MTFAAALFWIVAGITGASAVMVVVTQNIVRAAVWLLFTLVGVCGIYFSLGADFVGSTQLIVYVGGTLVLVVFGVMLTAQGPFVSMKAGAGEWAGVTVVGLLFFALLAATAGMSPWRGSTPPADLAQLNVATSPSTIQLGEAFLGIPDATPGARITGVPPVKDADGKSIAAPIRQRVAYLLPFEIVSVHLLVVLIGAAYLARAKRRREVPA
jgi:NADH-quinone oxidoreductase subunit J